MGKGLSGLLGLMRAAVVPPAAPSFPAPAALYRLDGDGTDASGNGRHLTMSADMYNSSAEGFGQELATGHGSIATFGGSGQLVSAAGVTIAAWLNISAPTTDDVGPQVGFGPLYVRAVSDSVDWGVGVQADEDSRDAVLGELNTGRRHVALTVATTGTFKLYIDGQQIATGLFDAVLPLDMAAAGFDVFTDAGSLVTPVDDVVVVYGVLTAEQVAYLAAGNQYPV